MNTINEGSDPSDDRHNTPPSEGAMDRFAELPAKQAEHPNPFGWLPPADDNARSTANREARLDALELSREEPYAGRWGDAVDPKDVDQALDYLTNRLPTDTEAFRPFNACLKTVLNELRERMASDAEPVEGVITPGGLHYFFPNGDHVTSVADWAALGQAEHQTTLNLRVLAAHLTTALDGINVELNRRLAFGK